MLQTRLQVSCTLYSALLCNSSYYDQHEAMFWCSVRDDGPWPHVAFLALLTSSEEVKRPCSSRFVPDDLTPRLCSVLRIWHSIFWRQYNLSTTGTFITHHYGLWNMCTQSYTSLSLHIFSPTSCSCRISSVTFFTLSAFFYMCFTYLLFLAPVFFRAILVCRHSAEASRYEIPVVQCRHWL